MDPWNPLIKIFVKFKTASKFISKIIECFKSSFLSNKENTMNAETPITNKNEIFNTNENEVKEKFDKFKSLDPYPSIPPALLNSVDVHNYILATGMIAPYDVRLKPVTFGIGLTNADYLYWEDREKIAGNLRDIKDVDEDGDMVFTIKSNSIIYVSPESYLRLPWYIAARFNLKINYIHKGLLLGTGPVVDPGFTGRLCIPLHNFTNNDYKIKIDKTFIWMEFTKISPHKIWENGNEEEKDNSKDRPPLYDNTLKDRQNRKISNYIYNAHPDGEISSSMANHRRKVKKISKRSKKALKKTEALNKAFLWAVVASLTSIAIALFAFTFRNFFYNNTEINIMQNQVNDLTLKIDSLNTVLFDLTKKDGATKTNEHD